MVKLLLLIIHSHTFLSWVLCQDLKLWATELQKPGGPSPLSVHNRRLGRNYIRGFPRAIWGTRLFPASCVWCGSWKPIDKTPANVYSGIYNPRESLDQAYKKFKQRTADRFCSLYQSCCSKLECAKQKVEALELTRALVDPYQAMPIIFLYNWCIMAWADYNSVWPLNAREHNKTKLMAMIMRICPDPCIGNPCRRIKFVEDTKSCTITGPFEDDYVCTCTKNTIWDKHKHSCSPVNPCSYQTDYPCHLNNTMRCMAVDETSVRCICKAGFMGPDCSLPINACMERTNKSLKTGNENCQIQHGNKCNPIPGTDFYNCSCNHGYQLSLSYTEPNCQERRDPCQNQYFESPPTDVNASLRTTSRTDGGLQKRAQYILSRGLVCLNGGQCVSSADMTRAMCNCPLSSDGSPLYLGQSCELPIGSWSAWSSASPCIPKDCGQTRYQWRRRRCLNATSPDELGLDRTRTDSGLTTIHNMYSPPIRCTGTSEEVMPCDSKDPCMTLRLPGYLREEILDYDTLHYFGYITLGYFILSICTWYVFATPILRALQERKDKTVAGQIKLASQKIDPTSPEID